MALHLKIVTPEKEIFDEEVSGVNIPTTEGIIGILPDHANLMAKVIPGELEIKKSGKSDHMAIGFGFLQVAKNNLVIMADLATRAVDINERELEEAKKRAEVALTQKLTDQEHAETLAFIQRATAQLRFKRRHRNI